MLKGKRWKVEGRRKEIEKITLAKRTEDYA